MGGEGFIVFLIKEKKLTLEFKVCGIWPLNHVTTVGRFGPSGVFTITKKKIHENSYQSNATLDESSKSGDEIEATTKLLNIVVIFQLVPTTTHTTFERPFSLKSQITM
jgi:hypothetical protein